MRVTLKKFTNNPKPYLRKAPFILTINKRDEFGVVPYVTYKKLTDQVAIHQNTVTQHMQTSAKKRSWLWRAFFG